MILHNCIKCDYFEMIPMADKTPCYQKYICPKCKVEFEAPIEMVEEFEQEDMLNGLPISTPPYIICPKCKHSKCVPLDYESKRGYHHKYKK